MRVPKNDASHGGRWERRLWGTCCLHLLKVGASNLASFIGIYKLFQREMFSCIRFYSVIVLNDQIIVYRRGFQVPVIHLQVPCFFCTKYTLNKSTKYSTELLKVSYFQKNDLLLACSKQNKLIQNVLNLLQDYHSLCPQHSRGLLII